MYRPGQSPEEYDAQFVTDQLRQVQQEFSAAKNELILAVLYAEPDRLYPGMLIYADGVTWNPGGGEGVYRRNKTNAAWVLIG